MAKLQNRKAALIFGFKVANLIIYFALFKTNLHIYVAIQTIFAHSRLNSEIKIWKNRLFSAET